MCMEDIRIGKQTYNRSLFTTIAAGATLSNGIIADVKRIAVQIATDGTQRVNIGIDGIGALNLFDVIAAAPFLRHYTIMLHGDVVRKNIQIRNTGAAGIDVFILETLYEYDEAPKHGTSQPPEIREFRPTNGGELSRLEQGLRPLGKSPFGVGKG